MSRPLFPPIRRKLQEISRNCMLFSDAADDDGGHDIKVFDAAYQSAVGHNS